MTSHSTSDTVVRPFVLGLATGARTTAGVTVVALTAKPSGPVSALLTSTWGKRLLSLACVGELIGDKLPMTPSRLAGGGFPIRLVGSSLSGVAIAERDGIDAISTAGLAVAGACLWAVVGSTARRAAAARGWSDLPVALAEDLLTAAFAYVGAAAAR